MKKEVKLNLSQKTLSLIDKQIENLGKIIGGETPPVFLAELGTCIKIPQDTICAQAISVCTHPYEICKKS
jgi:hypothetical protein